LFVAALALVVSVASAQAPAPLEDQTPPPPESGVEIAGRVGYGIPLGDITSGIAVKGIMSGNLPLGLELGYRINHRWFAGAFLHYGLAQVKDCSAGSSCSGFDLRTGIEGQYHLLPRERAFDPWLGLGIGYEIFQTTTDSGAGVSTTLDARGIDFAELSGGFDYRLSDGVAIGPWLNVSVGQFSTLRSEDIGSKAIHLWIELGARIVFDIM
jgi:hypothetical protein